jgi:AcrR family transcriptional regulator
VPKRVDHDQRRRHIAAAVWRLASTNGLEDVTLRKVAAEAEVSMRLVQYYFGTRHELLVKALEILNHDTSAQVQEQIPEGAAPRDVLRTVLLAMLPLDEQRRTRYLVHLAYFVRSLSDETLAGEFRETPPVLEQQISDLIGWGQAEGRVPAAVDTFVEAELLLATVDGLQTAVVLGQRSVEQTVTLVDRLLDRLFTA